MGCRIAEVAPRDRPRERLERLGAEALTDAELAALVLRTGGAGVSALELADSLLADSGGVGGLATAELQTLVEISSMGAAKASALVAAFELGRRASVRSTPKPSVVRDAADVVAVARRELTGTAREVVLVLVLSASHRLIKTQRLTVGTDTRCLLEPRDVLRAVVTSGGVGFAVAHNHPSGDLRPSPEDIASTKVLKRGAESVGVRFLDHVIVSSSGWKSVVTGSSPRRHF